MKKDKMNRHYVSPLDQFLTKFDQEHPGLSESQKTEIEKYRRIYLLRDKVTTKNKDNKLPEDF